MYQSFEYIKEPGMCRDVSEVDVHELHTFMVTHGHDDAERPLQPLFAFFSDPPGLKYKYFGKTTMTGFPFPKLLTHLANSEFVQAHVSCAVFNAAFVNLYRSGRDHVTPHRDKTHGRAPILSFSFYEPGHQPNDERCLCVSPASDVNMTTPHSRVSMAHGSLVVMHPWLQETCVHWVPPSDTDKWRLNVTLRMQDDM